MDRHLLAEERSIELHRAVAARLAAEPTRVAQAQARVRGWRQTKEVAPYYVEAWERILALPRDALCQAIVDRSESARALRQVTPFAGVLAARERWRIWRKVSEELLAR